MLTNPLAHVTLTEVPAGLLLFSAGIVLGGLVAFAFRYLRTS